MAKYSGKSYKLGPNHTQSLIGDAVYQLAVNLWVWKYMGKLASKESTLAILSSETFQVFIVKHLKLPLKSISPRLTSQEYEGFIGDYALNEGVSVALEIVKRHLELVISDETRFRMLHAAVSKNYSKQDFPGQWHFEKSEDNYIIATSIHIEGIGKSKGLAKMDALINYYLTPKVTTIEVLEKIKPNRMSESLNKKARSSGLGSIIYTLGVISWLVGQDFTKTQINNGRTILGSGTFKVWLIKTLKSVQKDRPFEGQTSFIIFLYRLFVKQGINACIEYVCQILDTILGMYPNYELFFSDIDGFRLTHEWVYETIEDEPNKPKSISAKNGDIYGEGKTKDNARWNAMFDYYFP